MGIGATLIPQRHQPKCLYTPQKGHGILACRGGLHQKKQYKNKIKHIDNQKYKYF